MDARTGPTDLLDPPAPPPTSDRPRSDRLRRSRRHRMLGGVAGGLATRYDVDVALVRVAFVVLACAWGAGLVLYLAMWAIVPSEPGDGESVDAEPSPTWLTALLLAGVVVLGFVLASTLWGGPRIGSGLGLAWVVLLGVLVLVALTRPRRAGTSLLRVLAVLALGAVTVAIVALGVVLGIVASTGVPMTGGVGDRVYQPASLSQVQSTYRTSIGDMTVDLRHVHFGARPLHVTATVAVGRLTVEVPPGVVVDVSAKSGVGNVEATPSLAALSNGGAHHPQLVLTAETGIGQVRIIRASPNAVYF